MLRRDKCPLPLVETIYRERVLPLCDGTVTPLNVYIPREQGDYLYSLVRTLKPEVTVEVGMANGLSTLFIAAALSENGRGRHIAIDPYQSSDWHNVGTGLLRQAGFESLVQLIEKPSHQALPEVEQAGVRSQFIFIDGSHLFDYVLTDFLCADRILDTNGLMAFDDSDWSAITAVLRYAVLNRHYDAPLSSVVIEEDRYRPTLSGRLLRSLGRRVPKLGEKLQSDFTLPSHNLGLRGRCVVLRKLAEDDRDSQTRFHHPF